MLCIKNTKYGRGMFTTELIKAGDIFDVAPVIVVPQSEAKYIAKTILDRYAYEFGRDLAIALGFGSLYNHSKNPNAEWYVKTDRKIIFYRAIKDIPAGRQIFVDYGYDPKEKA